VANWRTGAATGLWVQFEISVGHRKFMRSSGYWSAAWNVKSVSTSWWYAVITKLQENSCVKPSVTLEFVQSQRTSRVIRIPAVVIESWYISIQKNEQRSKKHYSSFWSVLTGKCNLLPHCYVACHTAVGYNQPQCRLHLSWYTELLCGPPPYRRGPHIASHSVCPSVCPSVPLSLPSVTSFRQPLASRMYFLARTEGRISYGHLGRTDSCLFTLWTRYGHQQRTTTTTTGYELNTSPFFIYTPYFGASIVSK